MAELLQDYERPAGRPTFITVLCILTFIGSGWGLIGGAIQYFSAEKQAQAMTFTKEKASTDIQKMDNKDEGSKMAEKMVNSMTSAFTVENLKKAGLAAILAAVFCLGGALMMWKLKKTGYYLYIVGTLVGIASPFIIYGSSNIMSIISSVLVGFIGVIFVILYGVNLKYMK
ncbi:MAG: hypothetical protein H7Z13_07190 [Ferruginibacter sp.]|nr:hypothetical protein [Ferruginibacter sp.]